MNTLRFGTEGLRGAPGDIAGKPARDWTATFLAHARTECAARTVFVGHGGGEEAARIAAECVATAEVAGYHAVDCGEVTGPALALAGLERDVPSIMVTGDRHPGDANGIAFNMPAGGISRRDEEAIRALRMRTAEKVAAPTSAPDPSGDVGGAYAAHVAAMLGRKALEGTRVAVVDDGSGLARAVLAILVATGADATLVERGSTPPYGVDALAMVGAGLVTLALPDGTAIPDESAALLACHYLGAAGVAVPVTSADGFADDGLRVSRTPVDAAAVTEAMAAMADDGVSPAVGVAPSGGIMVSRRSGQATPRVPDRLLAVVAALAWCRESGTSPSDFVAGLGATAVGEMPGIDPDRTRTLVRNIVDDGYYRDAFFAGIGRARSMDETDGLHVDFGNGRTLHLRSKGEGRGLRCHARAKDPEGAERLLEWTLHAVTEAAAA